MGGGEAALLWQQFFPQNWLHAMTSYRTCNHSHFYFKTCNKIASLTKPSVSCKRLDFSIKQVGLEVDDLQDDAWTFSLTQTLTFDQCFGNYCLILLCTSQMAVQSSKYNDQHQIMGGITTVRVHLSIMSCAVVLWPISCTIIIIGFQGFEHRL